MNHHDANDAQSSHAMERVEMTMDDMSREIESGGGGGAETLHEAILIELFECLRGLLLLQSHRRTKRTSDKANAVSYGTTGDNGLFHVSFDILGCIDSFDTSILISIDRYE